MTRDAFLLFYVLNLALFAVAIRSGFARPSGVSQRMRALAGAGISVAAVQIYYVLLRRSIPIWRECFSSAACIASLLLFGAAERATRDRRLSLAHSIDLPDHLNSAGPYRYVRHPFYTAYMLNWLAPCIYTMSGSATAMAVLMFALYFSAAKFEEHKFKISPFEIEYRAYSAKTGMFMPKLRIN